MYKDYQKPDFEYASLIVEDELTGDFIGGSPGLEEVPDDDDFWG